MKLFLVKFLQRTVCVCVVFGLNSAVAQKCNNYIGTGILCIDFAVQGIHPSVSSVTVAKGSTYEIQDYSINGCQYNAYTWTILRRGYSPYANQYTLYNPNTPRPSFKINVPGVYDIKLFLVTSSTSTFWNCGSFRMDYTRSEYVKLPYTTPVAKFNSNGTSGNKSVSQGSTVSLTDVSDNFPMEWKWTISPSTGFTYTSGSSTSQNPKVRFTNADTYTISLLAKNEAGSHTITKTNHITVNPAPITVDFAANNSSTGPVWVTQNSAVSFTDLSTNTPNSWKWTLNPTTGFSYSRGSSIDQAPDIKFNTIGIYDVSLMATNTIGSGTKSKPDFIVVRPVPPSAPSPVVYCVDAATVNLTATGTALKWYSSPASVTVIPTPKPSSASAGTTYYYVSQTINGIESARTTVAVVINPPAPGPVVTSPLYYCQNASATALSATGTNLKWYTVATGGTASTTAPTPSTTVVGSKSYYVSQTDDKACESQRSEIVVQVISALGNPTAASPVNYCLNAEALPLAAATTNGATGLNWYTVSSGGSALAEAPTPLTNATGTISYYVSQTKAGCTESTRKTVSVITSSTPTPDPPAVVTDLTYDMNEPSLPLQATGTSLKWYLQAIGGIFQLNAFTPSTFSPGERTYYVSQTINGCESRRAQIKILVNQPGPGTAPNWSKLVQLSSGINNSSSGKSLTGDKNGNLFVTGGFNRQVNFGKDTLGQDKIVNPVNFLRNSFYVVKYRNNLEVEWVATGGGGYDETAQEYATTNGLAVTFDKDGNVLVTGTFWHTINIGGTALVSGFSNEDVFIAKYSPTGAFLWARKAGSSTGSDYVRAITTDKDGNVYISGLLPHSMVFGGITVNGVIGQAYLAKYNPAGTALWVKTIGGSGAVTTMGTGLASDTTGNTFLTGENLLLAKHNAAGTLLLKKNVVLTTGSRLNGRSIYQDAQGQFYVCGDFRGTVTFDNGARIESSENANAFIVKFSKEGEIIWVTSGAGLLAYDIVTDEYGSAYLAGEHGNAKLGKFSVISKGSNDLFVAKLSDEGVPMWFKSNGSTFRDAIQALAIDKKGQVFIKGYGYSMTLDSISLTAPDQNQFVMKLGSSLPPPQIEYIDPTSGYPFTKVTIYGDGMLNADSVTFNGVKAGVEVVDKKTIRATVPQKATSGSLKVFSNKAGAVINDSSYFIVKEYVSKAYPLYKWKWAKLLGSREDLTEKDIAADANGNVFITGEFTNTLIIGDTTIVSGLTSCMYLAKFSPDGALLWLRSAGGSSASRGVRLTVDNAGNVAVAGSMQNDFDGGSFSLGDVTLDLPISNSGGFVAKFNSVGDLLGLQGMGGTGNISISGMGFDVGGGTYVTGSFSGTVKFGPFSLTSAGGSDNFLVRYHSSLQYPIYAMREGTIGSDIPWSLAQSEFGRSYVTENKSGTVTLNVYSSLGVKQFTRSLVDPIAGGAVFLRATSVDQFDNLYLTGTILAMGKFQNTLITSSSVSDAFVAKYKASGDLDWVRNFHGTFPSPVSKGTSIFANKRGEVYVGGTFEYNIVFDKDTLNGFTSNKDNIFFSKFDSLGNIIWATYTGNTVDDQTATSMYTNPYGHLYVSGNIIGTVPFGDTTLEAGDVPARYLAKMQGAPETPVILKFTPREGSAGDTVLVEGRYLNVWEGRFNETPAYNIIPVSDEAFRVVVPVGASTGAIGGYNGVGFGKSEENFKIISASLEVKLCPGSSGVLVSSFVGNTYQWQMKKPTGDFEDIQPSEHFGDVLTSYLKLIELPSGYFGSQFRCIVDGVPTPPANLRFIAYWNGGKDLAWENLENWGCGKSLPDAFTEVIIPAGANVVISGNIIMRKITVGDGATIKVEPGYNMEIIDPH